MYCINCGVKLADIEKKCPLCGTVPYHPELVRQEGKLLYPMNRYPQAKAGGKVILGTLTIMLLVPILVTLICDGSGFEFAQKCLHLRPEIFNGIQVRAIRRKKNIPDLCFLQQLLYRFGMVCLHIIHHKHRIRVQIRQQVILQVLFEFLYRCAA